MVELKLANAYSPMLFTVDGYQLVVMPMLTDKANEQAKADREAKGEAEPAESQPEATEQEPEAKSKPKKAKRSRKAKEPVTV
jgi:DNA polymerase-3 subunit beta